MPIEPNDLPGQGQHDRCICPWPQRYPLHCIGADFEVGAHWTEVDKATTCLSNHIQPTAQPVFKGTTSAHLRVLPRHTTECDDQTCVACEYVPTGVKYLEFGHWRHNMRQQHLGSGIAVGLTVHRAATYGVHKAPQLALRMVKTPSAGPAIGAGINRLVAVEGDHQL